jgi:nicotinate-nucleotide--dimethylbenzimidazole phosphoribosyltransferase
MDESNRQAERLAAVIAAIPGRDAAVGERARRLFDAKTKPRASLGRLEDLGCELAAIRGEIPTRLEPVIVVAAGDHGVCAEAVSAYPQEVTWQMLANFAAGGAAINVLAARAGARLIVVDAGVARPFEHEAVRPLRVGAGTANLARGPAMTLDQTLTALLAGSELAGELAAAGCGVVGLGEMGIGNSTSASALAAAYLGLDPGEVCGHGTGLDEEGLERKVDAVRRGLAANAAATGDALALLAALGGFEIAFLAGLAIGAAAAGVVVLLDGFITGAAALAAGRIAPACAASMIAAHRSAEPGHAAILAALGLEPLLDLGLRLGEGSGAALALPLLAASLAVLNEMATFADAGVTDTGR